MLTDSELQELAIYCVRYLNAKQGVDMAKMQQNKAKVEIANRISTGGASQKTVTLHNGTKITVARGFNTKIDADEISKLFDTDEEFENFPKPLLTKTEQILDAQGYEWYRVNHPVLFAKIAEHVTLTPKAVSVTVKPPKGG